MAALCLSFFLNAAGIFKTRLISRRRFDGVHASIPSVADEADGSGSLNLFDGDVESCGSVSMHRLTKLSAQLYALKFIGVSYCNRVPSN
jgi:hypothetical protein